MYQFVFFFFLSCSDSRSKNNQVKEDLPETNQEVSNFNPDSLKLLAIRDAGIVLIPENNYVATKNEIGVKRNFFNRELQKATSASTRDSVSHQAGKYLEDAIVNKLIPYWYGTPWDFNGYTSKPNQGVIACGYFVFTVLRDAGFNLNRYDFSKLHGYDAAVSLNNGVEPLKYECIFSDCFIDSFTKSAEEGLYFIALTFHVGFLYYKNGYLFFIHSNYINSEGVVIELAAYSEALRQSSHFYYLPLTTNKDLILKWINFATIPVIKH